MAEDHEIADALISGRLKKSRSYHAEYGGLTFGQIKSLAAEKPPDKKARQMKKLIEQRERLLRKLKGRRK